MPLLDLALRGGATALLALIALVVLRDRRGSPLAALGAAFACGVVVHLWRGAPGFSTLPPSLAVPVVAAATGNNLLFWLLARRIFDDGFSPRPWHAGAWGLIVLLQVANQLGAGSPVLGPLLTLQAPAFAAMALVQTVRTWRDDLIERRRLLRVFIVLACAAYIIAGVVAERSNAHGGSDPGGPIAAAALLAVAFVIAAGLLRLDRPAKAATPPRPQSPPENPADDLLLVRLRRVMAEERPHRDEGLTVAKLAARLAVPDYRLRRLINQRLGHANFQAFVNGFRLDEARQGPGRSRPGRGLHRDHRAGRRLRLAGPVQSRLQGGRRPDPQRLSQGDGRSDFEIRRALGFALRLHRRPDHRRRR